METQALDVERRLRRIKRTIPYYSAYVRSRLPSRCS